MQGNVTITMLASVIAARVSICDEAVRKIVYIEGIVICSAQKNSKRRFLNREHTYLSHFP